MEVFEGQVVRVDPADNQLLAPHLEFQKPQPASVEELPLREQLRNSVGLESAALE